MRLKAKAKPVELAQFERDSLITRAEAVRLIAQTLRRVDEDDSEACDRVSHQFTYAAENGQLPQLTSGKFIFGELAAWAQDKWGKFGDWPAIRITQGAVSRTLDGVSCESLGAQLPPDLPQCHQRILALVEEVAALHRKNAALRREVAELRPYQVRYEELRQKRRKAAQKPRGPRTK